MTWDLAVLLVLKLTVLFGLAWAGTALMRRASAAFRHLIWTSAVAAALLLPALEWMIPEWKVPVVTRTVSVIQAPVAPEVLPAVAGSPGRFHAPGADVHRLLPDISDRCEQRGGARQFPAGQRPDPGFRSPHGPRHCPDRFERHDSERAIFRLRFHAGGCLGLNGRAD